MQTPAATTRLTAPMGVGPRRSRPVFLQENGSYKSTAERLILHKNTIQYRVRKAEEGLRHRIVRDGPRIELALLAAQG